LEVNLTTAENEEVNEQFISTTRKAKSHHGKKAPWRSTDTGFIIQANSSSPLSQQIQV